MMSSAIMSSLLSVRSQGAVDDGVAPAQMMSKVEGAFELLGGERGRKVGVLGEALAKNQGRPCPRIGNAKALLASPRRPKPKRALTTAPGPHSGRQAANWL
jgi:hypothetical protein